MGKLMTEWLQSKDLTSQPPVISRRPGGVPAARTNSEGIPTGPARETGRGGRSGPYQLDFQSLQAAANIITPFCRSTGIPLGPRSMFNSTPARAPRNYKHGRTGNEIRDDRNTKFGGSGSKSKITAHSSNFTNNSGIRKNRPSPRNPHTSSSMASDIWKPSSRSSVDTGSANFRYPPREIPKNYQDSYGYRSAAHYAVQGTSARPDSFTTYRSTDVEDAGDVTDQSMDLGDSGDENPIKTHHSSPLHRYSPSPLHRYASSPTNFDESEDVGMTVSRFSRNGSPLRQYGPPPGVFRLPKFLDHSTKIWSTSAEERAEKLRQAAENQEKQEETIQSGQVIKSESGQVMEEDDSGDESSTDERVTEDEGSLSPIDVENKAKLDHEDEAKSENRPSEPLRTGFFDNVQWD